MCISIYIHMYMYVCIHICVCRYMYICVYILGKFQSHHRRWWLNQFLALSSIILFFSIKKQTKQSLLANSTKC